MHNVTNYLLYLVPFCYYNGLHYYRKGCKQQVPMTIVPIHPPKDRPLKKYSVNRLK